VNICNSPQTYTSCIKYNSWTRFETPIIIMQLSKKWKQEDLELTPHLYKTLRCGGWFWWRINHCNLSQFCAETWKKFKFKYANWAIHTFPSSEVISCSARFSFNLYSLSSFWISPETWQFSSVMCILYLSLQLQHCGLDSRKKLQWVYTAGTATFVLLCYNVNSYQASSNASKSGSRLRHRKWSRGQRREIGRKYPTLQLSIEPAWVSRVSVLDVNFGINTKISY